MGTSGRSASWRRVSSGSILEVENEDGPSLSVRSFHVDQLLGSLFQARSRCPFKPLVAVIDIGFGFLRVGFDVVGLFRAVLGLHFIFQVLVLKLNTGDTGM